MVSFYEDSLEGKLGEGENARWGCRLSPEPGGDIPTCSWVKYVRELVRKTRWTLQHHSPPGLAPLQKRYVLWQQYYLYKGRKSIANTDNQGLSYITEIIMERKGNRLSLVPLPIEGEGGEGSLSVSH